MKNDATAFYTYEEYTASLPELINFGIDRAKSISAQLDGSQPSTSYGNIETTVNLTTLGSQGMNNKNMAMQRPDNNTGNTNAGAMLDKNSQESQINLPNMDNNVDSTTSASLENNDTNKGQMQKPNINNENTQMNKPNENNNNNNINPEDMINKNNNLPTNEENFKWIILKFCGYFTFLLISIIFVALFKRKKFKAK